jgi:hypothetical protein
MVAFTENEQKDFDLSWYAIDADGKIAHFLTGGFRLLPPSIAKSKENLEKLDNYFNDLPDLQEANFVVCPYLKSRLDESDLPLGWNGYIKLFAEMSAKGLYAYDYPYNPGKGHPFIRVTTPKKQLTIEDLPDEIKNLLVTLRLSEIKFSRSDSIPEAVTKHL